MIHGEAIRYDEMEEAGVEPDFDKLAADAYANMNAYGPDGRTYEEATIERVNGMKEEYGNGVSTLIMFYNATGSTLKFDEITSESGHLFKYEPDRTVYNGQWSCFLHVKTAGAATGSFGKIGYWLQGGVKRKTFWLNIDWETPWSGRNKATATVLDSSRLTAGGSIVALMKAIRDMHAKSPFGTSVSVSQNSSPILRVVVARKTLL